MNKDEKRLYFTQEVAIESATRDMGRLLFQIDLVKDKTVLHVGFVDYPLTKVKKSMHLQMAPFCKRLDGIDPNITEELKTLLTVSNGTIYESWDTVPNDYDVIMIPEVIEHVDNVREFLETIDQFKGKLVITAPCAYTHKDKAFEEIDGKIYEYVHPDHNCWYSPYTLKNVVEKYSKNRKVTSVHLIADSVAVICE